MTYLKDISLDTVTQKFVPYQGINSNWTYSLGIGTEAIVNDLAVDNQGGIVAIGSFVDTGGDLSFALKLSRQGDLIWLKQWGRSDNSDYEWGDTASEIAIDSAGNSYVTGRVAQGVSLDNQSVEGSSDAYLLKFDTDGMLLWARYIRQETQADNYGWDYGEDVYIVDDSNIIVGSIQTDGDNANSIGSLQSIRSYRPDGTLRWETILREDGGLNSSVINILPNDATSISVINRYYDGILGENFLRDGFDSDSISTISISNGLVIDNIVYSEYKLDVNSEYTDGQIIFADNIDRYYPNTADSTSLEGYGETWGFLKTVSKIDLNGEVTDIFPYGQLSGSASIAAISSHPGSLWFIERLFEYPYAADKGLRLAVRNELGEKLFSDQLTYDDNHNPVILYSHTDSSNSNYIIAGWSTSLGISIRSINISIPFDIVPSNSSFDESIPAGSSVGSFSTKDFDLDDFHSYSFVSGDGDTDNAAFSITGNQLTIKASPDFESKSSYSIRIRSTDQGGLFFERAVTLTVNDLNEAPTALSLSASSVNENIAAGSVVATLATTDPDAANTFSYSLVSGSGDGDNNAFLINGNQLRIKASPDFESKSSYSLRIRSTDQGGLFFERAVTLSINDLNEAPTTTAVITGLSDNTGPIQGTVAPGGRSDDRTPTLTGTLSTALAAGETLRLYNGKALLGTAKVNNRARIWSYTPAALATTAGTTHSFTARVADAAGNLGRASAARKVVLDTTAPRAVAFSPRDGAIAVELNANLSLRFSEAIRRGSGVIQLRTGSATGAIRERFDAATSTRLRISGDRLTVDPSRNLLPNTRYVLTIPAGAITDRAGNRFSGSTSYDLRTIHAITGNASSNVLAFSSTVDRLTGLGGRDTFRLSSLRHALLPAAVSTPIDRITDLASGIDRIDAPVARPLAQALNPVNLGAVADLSAASITALLTPENFPALSTTSTGGAASFSYADPQAGRRTFLAINNAAAGFSPATDAILEITGFSGNLNQLQVF